MDEARGVEICEYSVKDIPYVSIGIGTKRCEYIIHSLFRKRTRQEVYSRSTPAV